MRFLIKYFRNKQIRDILFLRLLIITGFLSLIIFFTWLLNGDHIGDTFLYYLLIFVMLFSALKNIGEWYHYFTIKSPEPPKKHRHFTVDVFTTYCAGEPIKMIEETLKAIKEISYPHESYLCDESNSEYLKGYCESIGVKYVTRIEKKFAKAGNINNALNYSTGEICVVLDPDHVPQPNFLDPIIPYFNDPEIGYVQIVQAYKNIRESIISRGAAQQTFQFYGPMMMSMNSYGTVLAIGANCTFRREALESIGGHAAGLAEDMHTAMQLHAKGWKSVYVPKILARGLVPSTLDAYYKQQLKWSRGVFELLFTTYPRLFGKFTWRQKIHYGFLPFHYFSGIVYLVNFLIPILSLFLAVIPLKVDLVEFALFSSPFLINTLLIRHYVQRWVMEESERGFHLIGGLLQIGTWWVHGLGFIYSVLRKKVPYIPTPKGDEEGNNFILNIPNILIILISCVAIIYGISINYTPYVFVMAGLAATNCLFMLFMIIAGMQKKISRYYKKFQLMIAVKKYQHKLRFLIWNVKHDIYSIIRKVALPVSLVLTVIIFSFLRHLNDFAMYPQVQKEGQFYTGVFSPIKNDGLTTLTSLKRDETLFNMNFNIVSCYIPWGDSEGFVFPSELLQAYINGGKYPLITWEPWVSTFKISKGDSALENENRGLSHIYKGVFDEYIIDFAKNIKELNHPVFLRFAHEHDNPFYPWSTTGGNSPQDFIECWQYVHKKFDSLSVQNIIWVWNPWHPENLGDYFPGEEYVDWIGITGLNYGSYNSDQKWNEFDVLYQPFKDDPIFQKDIPVMISEFGSVKRAGNQKLWLKNAIESIEKHTEINAIVFFNSSVDINVPTPKLNPEIIDWKVENPDLIGRILKANFPAPEVKKDSSWYEYFVNEHPNTNPNIAKNIYDTVFKELKGVNYKKGNKWFRNYHSLDYRTVISDFTKIREMGANTIKWIGPGIYDRNVLKAAEELNFDVHYSFWIPDYIDFIKDKAELKDFTRVVLSTIKKHSNKDIVKSWNIGNDPWEFLNNIYNKPDLFLQREAYLSWLNNLMKEIEKLDHRPVTIDMFYSQDIQYKTKRIYDYAPQLSAFGLVIRNSEEILLERENFDLPIFFSDILPENYLSDSLIYPTFLSSYQDLGTPNHITFSGLVNHEGKPKEEYHLVKKKWTGKGGLIKEVKYRILKEAYPIEPGRSLKYRALQHDGIQWQVINESSSVVFKWFLIKTDGYGNGKQMKEMGDGPVISFIPPTDYENFELLLSVDNGEYIIQTKTKLHTPLTTKNIGNVSGL